MRISEKDLFVQTDAVKTAAKMQLMLYTAVSELKLGLFVIHSVQTVNPADQMQRLDSVRGGERACWKIAVAENVLCLSKGHIPYNQDKQPLKRGLCIP